MGDCHHFKSQDFWEVKKKKSNQVINAGHRTVQACKESCQIIPPVVLQKDKNFMPGHCFSIIIESLSTHTLILRVFKPGKI